VHCFITLQRELSATAATRQRSDARVAKQLTGTLASSLTAQIKKPSHNQLAKI